MTIVADSGSTKTTWADVETGKRVVTEGLNPHFNSDNEILRACNAACEALTIDGSQPSVYFYGAGCGDARQRSRLNCLLQKGFNTKEVRVDTDMLGACRAVSNGKPGIVAILGTGSNACYFDGTKIIYTPYSTGYILGDNGSANNVGRILLDNYLTHEMPENLRHSFHELYPLTDAEFMDSVYHHPFPNRFLASLAPFAVKNRDNEYCMAIIKKTLLEFHYHNIKTIETEIGEKSEVINFVGSYAKSIESEIHQFFGKTMKYTVNITANPIEGMIKYHKSF